VRSLIYFISNEYDKIKCFKNRLSGILSVGNPNISVVSSILSVGHPSFSVVSGILSVVGIPPVPEEIQLLMYAHSFIIKKLTNSTVIVSVFDSSKKYFNFCLFILLRLQVLSFSCIFINFI